MSACSEIALGELIGDASPGFACGEDVADGIFQIRMNNITTEGQLDLSKRRRIPRNYRNIDRYFLQPGDVLFNATNSPDLVGKTAFFPGLEEPAVFSNHFLRLRPLDGKIDGRYLTRWLNFQFQHGRFKGMCRQWVNQATVGRDALLSLKVSLPPLPDQRRIATILDKADELRAKRRAALKKLDELTQSIFLDMFGDPATNPKGFPIAHMGDVCDVRDGTHDSPKYISDGGYPLVTSKNVTGGVVDLTDVNYISEADYVQINKRSKVDRGDIILPMIGTIGSPVLVDHEPCYAIKNVALIKFLKTSPSAVFVRHLLSGHYFDYIVSRKNRGGTQKFVSLGDLRAFPLPLPSKGEQQEFARRVEAVEKARTISRTSEAELNALFASLQHRAFSGDLVSAGRGQLTV
jgi:type I restriction enzyme S subunit